MVLGKKARNAERLASGYRINRAADDAAGLAISEKMRRQIRGLSQGVENTQDGVSLCQVADGALDEVAEMAQRLVVLSVKAANGTNSPSDRQSIQEEVGEILKEIDRVSDTTKFNEQLLFGGSGKLTGDEMEDISTASVSSTPRGYPGGGGIWQDCGVRCESYVLCGGTASGGFYGCRRHAGR